MINFQPSVGELIHTSQRDDARCCVWLRPSDLHNPSTDIEVPGGAAWSNLTANSSSLPGLGNVHCTVRAKTGRCANRQCHPCRPIQGRYGSTSCWLVAVPDHLCLAFGRRIQQSNAWHNLASMPKQQPNTVVQAGRGSLVADNAVLCTVAGGLKRCGLMSSSRRISSAPIARSCPPSRECTCVPMCSRHMPLHVMQSSAMQQSSN